MFAQFVSLAALGLLFAAAPALSAEKFKIEKCQDPQGHWHYGDTAAADCAKSKIEILSTEGVKTKEIAAPPTAAELAEQEKNQEANERKKQAAEAQEKRDQILLSTYGHEDDIALVRDRKLSQLEAQIKASEDTLKSLRNALGRMETQEQGEKEKNDTKALAQTEKNIAQTKAQIERHEASVTERRKEQENVRKQYADDLKRYRELKAAPAAPTAKQ